MGNRTVNFGTVALSNFLSEVVAQAAVLKILKDSHSDQSRVFIETKILFTVKSLILAQDER